MQERLEKALAFSNYRQTLNSQFQKLKIKTQGLLVYAKNGGSFTITPDLICFLDYLDRTGAAGTTLLDDNNLPISIDDISEFLKDITRRYTAVTNDYHTEYQEIRKARNVKSILDIEKSE